MKARPQAATPCITLCSEKKTRLTDAHGAFLGLTRLINHGLQTPEMRKWQDAFLWSQPKGTSKSPSGAAFQSYFDILGFLTDMCMTPCQCTGCTHDPEKPWRRNTWTSQAVVLLHMNCVPERVTLWCRA